MPVELAAVRGSRLTRLVAGVDLRLIDIVVVIVVVAIAAIARFVDLPTRGTWDADQGHDMLVLSGLVNHGTLPLLGPPTSIGDFHHGALYYYLLAPAALLGGSDPVAVVAEIAILGTAAVALAWWIARSMAGVGGHAIRGSVAGGVAGLTMAVSSSAIDESTFLWNPNVIAFSAALSIAAAWRAWTTRRARWWFVALAAQAVTMQAHVLGTAFLVPLLGFGLADLRRRPPAERRPLVGMLVAGLAIIAVSYTPLLAWELGHDFSETRAAAAFLAGGGQGVALNPIARLLFVGLRILAWPLTGLLTDALAPGVAAGVIVIAIGVWLAGKHERGEGEGTAGVRWLALSLAFCWLVLALGVGGLATVTPLPVDHYHAFLDPVVFVLLGLGAAHVLTLRAFGLRLAAFAGLTLLVAWNIGHWPPAVAADGGWPAAEAAAERIGRDVEQVGDVSPPPIRIVSLPDFKSPEAYSFPLIRAGFEASTSFAGQRALVMVCDSLFVDNCGGPAEAQVSNWPIVDRFVSAPGRTITVFERPGAG